MEPRETIVKLPATIEPVSAVRSTLLQSSLATLKERGLGDRYFAKLDPSYHELIRNTLAPTWVPLDVAMAHYRACDALGLDREALMGIGQSVGDRIQGSYLGTIARGAKLAGITPWVLFRSFDRIWYRVFQGGAAGVTKVGPKDAIVEIERVPLARIEYFRIAFMGLFIAGAKFVGARSVHVDTVFGRCGPDRLTYRVAWA